MTTYTDTFNRADSAVSLGTGWTARDGTMGIVSNQAYAVTAGGLGGNMVLASYDTGMGSDDMTVNITVGALVGAGTDLLVYVLGSNTGGTENVFAILQNGGVGASGIYTGVNWDLAAGATPKASGTVSSWSAADVIGMKRVGGVYTATRNGVDTALTWNDSGAIVPRDNTHRTVAIGAMVSSGNHRKIDSVSMIDTLLPPNMLLPMLG